MFGALLGHLGAAKQAVKRDSAILETRKRVEKVVRVKQEQKGAQLRAMERALDSEEKVEALNKKEHILTEVIPACHFVTSHPAFPISSGWAKPPVLKSPAGTR